MESATVEGPKVRYGGQFFRVKYGVLFEGKPGILPPGHKEFIALVQARDVEEAIMILRQSCGSYYSSEVSKTPEFIILSCVRYDAEFIVTKSDRD